MDSQDWLEQWHSRSALAYQGIELSKMFTSIKRGDELRQKWATELLTWASRVSATEWADDRTATDFRDLHEKLEDDLDPKHFLYLNIAAQIAQVLQRDARRFIQNRSESDLRRALVEWVHRLPEHHTAEIDEMVAATGEPESRVERIVDWAYRHSLVDRDKRHGFSITSEGHEWLTCSEPTDTEDSTTEAKFDLDVSFVKDDGIREVLMRNADELAVAVANNLHLSAIVLAGAISEGILYDSLLSRKSDAMAAKSCPKGKGGVLKDLEDDTQDWRLVDYIAVAAELCLIQNHTRRMADDVLRDFRNLIHPRKQVRDHIRPDHPEVQSSLAWLSALVRDIQAAS